MRRIFITGASSGIGLEVAKSYLERGDHVVACARTTTSLEELAGSYDGRLEVLKLDVTNKSAVLTAIAAQDTFDLAILNAGNCEYVDVDNFDSGAFERIFQVNMMGVVYCVEGLLKNLKEGSQLAIVGSIARYLPFTRSESYGASKAAIHYFTKSLEVDMAGSGISVHSISPGFVKTPLTDKNDFDMPFIISVEEAARRILSGLDKGKSEVTFPRRLAWTLKCMSYLPESWQRSVCVSMRDKARKEQA